MGLVLKDHIHTTRRHSIKVLVKRGPFAREKKADVATFLVRLCSFTCSLEVLF